MERKMCLGSASGRVVSPRINFPGTLVPWVIGIDKRWMERYSARHQFPSKINAGRSLFVPLGLLCSSSVSSQGVEKLKVRPKGESKPSTSTCYHRYETTQRGEMLGSDGYRWKLMLQMWNPPYTRHQLPGHILLNPQHEPGVDVGNANICLEEPVVRALLKVILQPGQLFQRWSTTSMELPVAVGTVDGRWLARSSTVNFKYELTSHQQSLG